MRAAAVGLLLLGGCDRVFQLGPIDDTRGDGGPLTDASTNTPVDAPADGSAPCTSWGPWGLPARLGISAIGFDDYAPTLSADNRRLIFHSERGTLGGPYEAVWQPGDPTFSAPTQLSIPSYDLGPFLSADGLQLWFQGYPTSTADILTTKRTSLNAPFGPVTAVDGLAVPGINEKDVAFTADLLTAVFVVGSGNDQEIAIADRASTSSEFGVISYVAVAANTGLYDCCPTLSADGLTLLWEGGSPYGLWQATRASRADEFANPIPFVGGDINAANGDPQLSYDGSRLVYAASTNEEEPDYDIYMLERTCAD